MMRSNRTTRSSKTPADMAQGACVKGAVVCVLVVVVSLGCQAQAHQPEAVLMASGPVPQQQEFVFVIDGSGSMIQRLPFVVRETERALESMGRHHHVTIICYSGRGVYEIPGPDGRLGIQAVTPEFKLAAQDWLDLGKHHFKTGGAGNRHAAAAFQRALDYQPRLIILLSDGMGGGGPGAALYEVDGDGLIAMIEKARDVSGTNARINTINFAGRDPLGDCEVMQRIADETGGTYKYVSARDLGLR